MAKYDVNGAKEFVAAVEKARDGDSIVLAPNIYSSLGGCTLRPNVTVNLLTKATHDKEKENAMTNNGWEHEVINKIERIQRELIAVMQWHIPLLQGHRERIENYIPIAHLMEHCSKTVKNLTIAADVFIRMPRLVDKKADE